MNVKIEKLVYGGEGLGHADGNTIFVPFVLPGETVTIRPVERKKKFVRGVLLEVTEVALDRVASVCPHFTACGGCHYQHISYEAQLKHKAEILRETLSRIGRVKWEDEIRTHASPPLGYRNRAQWRLQSGDPSGARHGAFGYNRGGSSTVLAIEQCPILAPSLEKVFLGLRGAIAAGEIPATLREIEAFINHDGERVLLNASFSEFSGAGQKLVDALRAAAPQAESILLHDSSKDRFELNGPGFISYQASGIPYRVGHLSFFQANRFLIDEMVAAVTSDETGSLALDLFAGVGLFALPLARTLSRVVAVEANEASTRDLRSNSDTAGVSLECVQQETERYLTQCKEVADLVVLDPPRAGAGAAVIQQLMRIAPKRIAYVSCDPSTLARD
ncbi:MAG: 23S rRNA (uracil(1939)-C(5))-methyltransferase RlmD, partial [Acidobacteria bacterium]|nr:23S rRNA (uracil(1939)-C(5))-methyltransferase RlmD [Acidobacteriota bacterium]